MLEQVNECAKIAPREYLITTPKVRHVCLPTSDEIKLSNTECMMLKTCHSLTKKNLFINPRPRGYTLINLSHQSLWQGLILSRERKPLSTKSADTCCVGPYIWTNSTLMVTHSVYWGLVWRAEPSHVIKSRSDIDVSGTTSSQSAVLSYMYVKVYCNHLWIPVQAISHCWTRTLTVSLIQNTFMYNPLQRWLIWYFHSTI